MEEVEEIASRPNSIPISCVMNLNMDGLLSRIWDMMALVRLEEEEEEEEELGGGRGKYALTLACLISYFRAVHLWHCLLTSIVASVFICTIVFAFLYHVNIIPFIHVSSCTLSHFVTVAQVWSLTHHPHYFLHTIIHTPKRPHCFMKTPLTLFRVHNNVPHTFPSTCLLRFESTPRR
jgi:hypothetical protein